MNIGIRCLLAMVGGYLVASLAAAALILVLEIPRFDAATLALICAFVIQVVCAIYVFAASSVLRACVGIGILAATLAICVTLQSGGMGL